MAIVRFVVAWLVMAALPMQGFAAATMLLCGQSAHATAGQQRGHDAAGADHASHGHGSHDAAASGHHAAVADVLAGAEDAAQGDDGTAQASAPADGHACPICASCCNLVALTESPTLSLASARPLPPQSQGPARVHSRAAPAPDKPPRA